MKFEKLPVAIATTALTLPTLAIADHNEIDLDEAQLYFELNDTDGDLGIHGKADGDAWKRMKIEGPEGDYERTILHIVTRYGLRRQGLTELFFESSEPTFDELVPDVFFSRFPQGVYEWEGRTLDYLEIEGEVFLSHIIPAAPMVVTVDGDGGNPGFIPEPDEDAGDKACWEVSEADAMDGVTIVWAAVTESHFDKWSVDPQPLLPYEEEKIPLGVTGDPGEVLYYEFVAEIDDTEFKATAVIPPAAGDATNSWTIPAEIIELAPEDEVKFEIIVRVGSGEGTDDDGDTVESRPGNQSAVEDCFEVVGAEES